MNSSAPHLEFAPPRTGGSLRALGLAVVAHVVLLVALTLGVQWKSDPVQQAFEAELWSSVPTEAAPPPPPPEPEVKPEPKPVEPEVKPIPVARPDAVVKAEAEIAMAKEKEKERAKERKRLEQEKLEMEKQLKAEAEKEKQDRLKKEQAEKDKQDKQAKLDQQKRQAQQDQANAAKAREDQLKRMEKLAGATGNGAPTSNGSAAQSSGPSGSYAGRIIARIKPNITYPDDVTGNPRTEVEIRVAPNGAILSRRMTQSSGIKSWDEAVLRAIDKTETLPRDTDGTVQPIMVMGFRPKD